MELIKKLFHFSNSRTPNIISSQRISKSFIVSMTPYDQIRTNVIKWLYKAQKCLRFNRSTLHMAIGLLDTIISKNFNISKQNWQLVSGSLLLICTKFNQYSPISVRKLNTMFKSDSNRTVEDYAVMEALICQTVNYNIVPQDNLYQKLSELQSKYVKEKIEECEKVVKLVLINLKELRKNRTEIIIKAIKDMLDKSGLNQKYCSRDEQRVEIDIVKIQLTELNKIRRNSF